MIDIGRKIAFANQWNVSFAWHTLQNIGSSARLETSIEGLHVLGERRRCAEDANKGEGFDQHTLLLFHKHHTEDHSGTQTERDGYFRSAPFAPIADINLVAVAEQCWELCRNTKIAWNEVD